MAPPQHQQASSGEHSIGKKLPLSLYSESRKSETSTAATLSALRRVDASIAEVLLTATHVTLYVFGPREWERGDVEGPLFVCRRSIEPTHVLVVLNRLSIEDLVQELVDVLEFEIVDHYLIFRKPDEGDIKGIWFHSIEEHATVSKLVPSLAASAAVQFKTHAIANDKEDADPFCPQDEMTEGEPTGALDLQVLRAAMHDLINDDTFLLEFHKVYQAKLEQLRR